MWTGQDIELKAKKYGKKKSKNGWKIKVQKIHDGENYASKYGMLVS
jgi:hypothetical protein